MREFRGAWVASVSNIDWPSKPGLSTAEQKAELLAILDLAARLKLNAIILQVRPATDALYASAFEPWSEYLTGQTGKAPEPFYDPLAFAVAEAHQRGLELHAWFNPFRARHPSGTSVIASNHISRTRPQLVRPYGRHLWLDPGEKEVRDHTLNVVLDVVRRYDIDGVHFDDYFYPYKEKDAAGKALDFPDDPSWKRYLEDGGRLDRDDWRRNNINTFIQRTYQAIKTEKSWVKFGISPFGLWRPGFPPQNRTGLDAYQQLFADSRQWLANGWVDYFAPQLYWSTADREQAYPVLLRWWSGENGRGRHLWPGIATSRIGAGRPAEELVEQIRLTRKQSGASGNIHWSVKPLLQNRLGIANKLRGGVYAQAALVPVSPWLDNEPPGKPKLYSGGDGSTGVFTIIWEPTGTEKVWLWVLQTRHGGQWFTEILPVEMKSRRLEGRSAPEVVAVSAVDRCGNLSAPAVLERRANPESNPPASQTRKPPKR